MFKISKGVAILVAALWTWKAIEFIAYQQGWIRGNLGWGYSVDVAVPIAGTAAASILWFCQLVLRRRRRSS